MKISELLTDESKWCKGSFAKTAYGFETTCNNPDACQWCLLGARYTANLTRGENDALIDAVLALYPNRCGIYRDTDSLVRFNDHPNTTFDDIKRVLEHAGL